MRVVAPAIAALIRATVAEFVARLGAKRKPGQDFPRVSLAVVFVEHASVGSLNPGYGPYGFPHAGTQTRRPDGVSSTMTSVR